MPLRKLNRTPRLDLAKLYEELVREWKQPSSSQFVEPWIYEIDPGGDEPVSLYVVWSKWEGIAGTDRADVILDAYATVYGKDAVVRVATAMGFTPEEARAYGLNDALGDAADEDSGD